MAIKVVADDKIPFLQGALEDYLDITYMPGRDITRDKLQDVDALIIRTRTACNEELLAGTPVKFIATATIGYDHIDTQYCETQGITWKNAPGCNSGSVQQYVASALLSFARDKNIDLSSHVMGIIGVGNVGRKILKLAEALSMQVVLNDPPRAREEGPCGFLSLKGVLREADFLTLHVPLNREGEDKTFHLGNEDFFRNMNPGSLLINSSRGEVIDTGALKNALQEQKFSGVILDVWENEPDIDLELPGKVTMATPHIAGYSIDGKANGTTMSVRALSEYFDLGLDEWEPLDIPAPENPVLFCNGHRKSFQEILTGLVLQTYDISSEKNWLIDQPSKFEYYRGTYPGRREFNAYRVETRGVNEEDKRKLRRLGFRLSE